METPHYKDHWAMFSYPDPYRRMCFKLGDKKSAIFTQCYGFESRNFPQQELHILFKSMGGASELRITITAVVLN